MIYLLFLVTLLLISCNPDQAKDNGKDETIEYFIPLSHRVEKDVDEMFVGSIGMSPWKQGMTH